jgi:hypothetical protein
LLHNLNKEFQPTRIKPRKKLSEASPYDERLHFLSSEGETKGALFENAFTHLWIQSAEDFFPIAVGKGIPLQVPCRPLTCWNEVLSHFPIVCYIKKSLET